MTSYRAPQLVHATLLATLVGTLTCWATSLGSLGSLPNTPSGLEAAQACAAMLVTPLLFAVFAMGWLALGQRLEHWCLRRLPSHHVFGARALCSLPLLSLPAFAVACAVTVNTSAWHGTSSIAKLAAVVVVLGPVARSGLTVADRGLAWLRQRHRRAAQVAVLALSAGALVAWIAGTASLRDRYAVSQLLSFGLIVSGIAVLCVGFAPRRPQPAALAALAALAVLGIGALLSPTSTSTRALFHAERPQRWFARALSLALPDDDADGSPISLGLLTGGDCDDSDPQRHPRAKEIPDNAVDENCFAGDLSSRNASLFARHQLTQPGGAAALGPSLNVVVVVIDSLRYDRRYRSGVDPAVMPHLASLASSGRVYSNFRTCAPRTRESVEDLLQVGDEFEPARDAARALHGSGMHTAFIASSWLARYAPLPTFRERHHPEARYGAFADDEVMQEVRFFIASSPAEPFFLFTHLLGAHEPYARQHCARGEDDYARYLCALSELDRQLERLRGTLVRSGLADRTLVVVTGDHGEEFGEHGGRYHAFTLFDEILRVPLVLAGPQIGPRIGDDPMGCYDFLPTVLSAARRQPPTPNVSRFGAGTQVARSRPLDGSRWFGPKLQAVVHRDYKLILDLATGLHSIWHLASDPAEQQPLSRAPHRVERELFQRMDAWLSEQAAPASGIPAEPSPQLAFQ